MTRKEAEKRIEEFRKRRGVDTLKRADRLLNALKHVQTANTHEKNTCIGILIAAVSNYKHSPTWELCKNLMNYFTRAEGFLYRVIKKYDRH